MAIYPEWVTADGGQAAPAGPAGTSADAGDPRADAADAAQTAGEVDGAGAANATSDTVEVAATSIAIDDAPVPPPTGWNDPLTGTDGPHYWDRLIISESARVRRYKRPTTIVFVEVAGLTRLGRLWGQDVAERTLVSAARTLSQSIRTSDHIARIEPIRFGILLTETAEIAAINFIERARAACERDLRVASEVVGVAFGWASPPKSNDLADAVALAQKRLEAELNEL
jgi:diguanylate cyclase (GGDEF)-like protein